jgi:hypothetical protein
MSAPLVPIVKKRLEIERDPFTTLQILSVRKTQLEQALSGDSSLIKEEQFRNRLLIFDF